MPLIFHSNILPQGQYAIWQTMETDDFFLSKLDLYTQEIQEFQTLKSKKNRNGFHPGTYYISFQEETCVVPV